MISIDKTKAFRALKPILTSKRGMNIASLGIKVSQGHVGFAVVKFGWFPVCACIELNHLETTFLRIMTRFLVNKLPLRYVLSLMMAPWQIAVVH